MNTEDMTRLTVDVDHLHLLPATLAQIRPAVEAGRVVSPNVTPEAFERLRQCGRVAPDAMSPPVHHVLTQGRTQAIAEMVTAAFAAGRVIDFGLWSNAMMVAEGARGGVLYDAGALAHPFRDPWCLFHRWEGGSSLILVVPLEPERIGGACEAIEMVPTQVVGRLRLMIGDRVRLNGHPGAPCVGTAIPSIWYYFNKQASGTKTFEQLALSNVTAPLMTALLILSTRGVVRETIRASSKLQHARAKSRKPPIPPYDRVDCTSYITTVTLRRSERHGALGGTHASPVPHLRRGHLRTLSTGTVTYVRDSLVNFTNRPPGPAQRSHYELKL